jgi:hypothetical protein
LEKSSKVKRKSLNKHTYAAGRTTTANPKVDQRKAGDFTD